MTDDTMRAAVVTATGGTDVIEVRDDVPRPSVGPNQVLVAVAASTINHTDIWVRRGRTEGKPPIVTGVDIAGVVAEVGEAVEGIAPDDRVLVHPAITCGACEWCQKGERSMCREFGAFGENRDGGHAEFVDVPASNVVHLPPDVSFEEAAAASSGFATSWQALCRRGDVTLGDDVLVIGASGGVGHAAVQVADEAGARVLACTSTEEKARRLERLGADHTIDYTTRGIDEAVSDLTDGRGVDVALDSVGGDPYKQAVRSLARGGRLVTYGATVGDADAALLNHIFWKQLRIQGSTGHSPHDFRRAMALVFDGVFSPVIDRVISLSEIPEAHEQLENRDVFGKIVVSL